jgi:hypothetical protein
MAPAYYLFLAGWAAFVAFLILVPLRRLAGDSTIFYRLLGTLLPALMLMGAGFALTPSHETLGFFLFGLGLLIYGYNWLANRGLWARAFIAWFGWFSPLYRTEASAKMLVVGLGAVAFVVGLGIMVVTAVR